MIYNKTEISLLQITCRRPVQGLYCYLIHKTKDFKRHKDDENLGHEERVRREVREKELGKSY